MSAKITLSARLRNALLKARAKRKDRLAPLQSGRAGTFTHSRADRHRGLDVAQLRKRRSKNRVARRSRRVNRLASKR